MKMKKKISVSLFKILTFVSSNPVLFLRQQNNSICNRVTFLKIFTGPKLVAFLLFQLSSSYIQNTILGVKQKIE